MPQHAHMMILLIHIERWYSTPKWPELVKADRTVENVRLDECNRLLFIWLDFSIIVGVSGFAERFLVLKFLVSQNTCVLFAHKSVSLKNTNMRAKMRERHHVIPLFTFFVLYGFTQLRRFNRKKNDEFFSNWKWRPASESGNGEWSTAVLSESNGHTHTAYLYRPHCQI